MPKSPKEMLDIMKQQIQPKTGRSFDPWIEVARATGLDRHKALTVHMKLEAIKNTNPRFTHRIRIRDVAGIDDEVLRSLQTAAAHVGG